MKRTFMPLLLVSCLLTAKEFKIGFVDANRVMTQYQATAAATSEFNDFVDAYRDSASLLKKQIEQLQAENETQKLVLSEEARLRKQDELNALTESYNQFLQTVFGTGGKVEQKNDALMTPLLQKINDAIAKVAEQAGFQIILDLSEGVYYASSDLDVTNLVVNELNLEYGPATVPPEEMKKVIVILPFREENPEAINADLGQTIQDELYRSVRTFSSRYTIVDKGTINNEIVRRGLGVNVIDDNQAYEIGTGLLCDYMIMGRVSKVSTKIDYTIMLREVKEKKELARRTGSVTEVVRLSEALNNDLRALLEQIE